MRALIRLLSTLVLLAVAGMAGYYYGYSTAMRGRQPLQSVGTSGSLEEQGRALGKELGAAGAEAGAALSDAALTGKIKSKMALDDTVQVSRIHVSTSGAVVTLTGSVRSRIERDRAVQLARETSGVKSVVDHLSGGH